MRSEEEQIPPFGLRVTATEESTEIALAGDLDLVAVRQLRSQVDAVIEECRGELVLDLGGVEFLDSSGVGMLLHMRALVGGRGVSMRVGRVSPPALRTLELTGLTEAFGVPHG